VTDVRRPIPPPRARPVAELASDTLLSRAEELARRWAIALIVAQPLEGIGDVPLEELAHDAPALCAQAVRALHSDLELDRLTGSGPPSGRENAAPARSLGSMSGAPDAPALALAVEALRGVLWEGVLEDTRLPTYGATASRQLAEVGDRLAYVCARMLVATLTAAVPQPPEPDRQAPPAGGTEQTGRQADESARPVLVDERAESARSLGPQANRALARALAPERPRSWSDSPAELPESQERSEVPELPRREEPAASRPARARAPVSRGQGADRRPAPRAQARQEIEIHDARGAEGPGAWIATIARQLDRVREDGLPFAVLLVEPLELEALRSGGPSGELLRIANALEDALAVALRLAPGRERGGQHAGWGPAQWSGSLTRERPGRYWLLAPETDRRGAERLAERVRSAVASAVEYRGTPLEVLIGTAACPEDGLQAAGLAAHADVGLSAARSARMRSYRSAVIDEAAER
jgi:hypothetical protein